MHYFTLNVCRHLVFDILHSGLDLQDTRYKIQETLFRVDIQIYNSVTLAMGYFVDKHSKNSVHVYIR